jgi:hypothetical protein
LILDAARATELGLLGTVDAGMLALRPKHSDAPLDDSVSHVTQERA